MLKVSGNSTGRRAELHHEEKRRCCPRLCHKGVEHTQTHAQSRCRLGIDYAKSLQSCKTATRSRRPCALPPANRVAYRARSVSELAEPGRGIACSYGHASLGTARTAVGRS